MDGAMDDIPVFSPAGAQALLAYHCSKKLLLLFLILDKDFAKLFNEQFFITIRTPCCLTAKCPVTNFAGFYTMHLNFAVFYTMHHGILFALPVQVVSVSHWGD
jgi:hypothetical protein